MKWLLPSLMHQHWIYIERPAVVSKKAEEVVLVFKILYSTLSLQRPLRKKCNFHLSVSLRLLFSHSGSQQPGQRPGRVGR